ncbi:ATP-binding protein [Mycobacterium sp. 050134]|uniref:ATP-binding protein n=1 Tax=Mycobacterium sp. 050134 TaxID=3096111 RepID=UPI002ED8AD78
MGWLPAMHRLVGAHVIALRERWEARPSPGSVHDIIDEIVAADDPGWAPAVREAAEDADAAIAADHRWVRLTEALGLPAPEVQWLALLAACELNPRLTRVMGYIDDTASPIPPSPALAAHLWNWPLGYQPGPASQMVRWELAGPAEGWQSTTPWGIDSDVAAFLAGRDDWRDVRADASVLDISGLECLHPALLAEMHSAAKTLDSTACQVELVGPSGSGRRTLLTQLADALGRRVALIDPDSGMRGLRTARLLDAVPLWVIDGDHPAPANPGGGLVLAARTAAPAAPSDGAVRLTWAMPPIRVDQRERLWTAATPRPAPALLTDWDLTPADVHSGAAAAAAGPVIAARVIRNRVRRGTSPSMSPLALPYDWDDLVVPPHVEAALRRLCDQVLFRRDVLDRWEFRRLVPMTAGVTALFAGPSGTGKTMAAQVLARTLDLDLFRVDLATVVSKYIGETEKQLAAVFEEAERSHVLVFFDEADALFGQRTKVRDAHDRFANIEIDFLLQRLDTFRGVGILATNRKSDLDAGFLRRLRTIVDFVAPTLAERLRLWQLALPAHTSTGEPITADLDHEWLASSLDLTGAEIKAIALAAAFDARRSDELITVSFVLEAARREMAKRGAVLRVEDPMAVGQ